MFGHLANAAFGASAAGLFGTLAIRGGIGAGENVLAGYTKAMLDEDEYTLAALLGDMALGAAGGATFHLGEIALRGLRGFAGSMAGAYWRNGAWSSKWSQLGLGSADELQKYLEKVMRGGAKDLGGGRLGFWDPSTRVTLVIDPTLPNGGHVGVNRFYPW